MVLYSRSTNVATYVAEHFNDPDCCDVTVWGPDEEKFHCFKLVLCCQSEVFNKMLNCNMAEGLSNEVRVGEIDPVALRDVLVFLHTGSCDLNQYNVLSISEAAGRFQIASLRSICNDYVEKHLIVNAYNAVSLLLHAPFIAQPVFHERCQDFVVKNMEELAPQLIDLPMDDMGSLIKRSQHLNRANKLSQCQYFDLAKGMIMWCASHPEREEVSTELLKHIDWEHLSRGDIIRLRCMKDAQMLPLVSEALENIVNEDAAVRVYHTSERGVWQEWELPDVALRTVYILAKGGSGMPDEEFGFRGRSKGAIVGGEFSFFSRGTKLKILIGSGGTVSQRGGGGGACVFEESDTGETKLLLVAGGAGGASDACVDAKQSSLVINEQEKSPFDGNGCAALVNKASDFFITGKACTLLDGGMRGGGGFYGGRGAGPDICFGQGGSSYVCEVASLVLRSTGNIGQGSVSIWENANDPLALL